MEYGWCRGSRFLQYKVHVDMRGLPGEGASNDSRVVENDNFLYFARYFFESFRSKANIII